MSAKAGASAAASASHNGLNSSTLSTPGSSSGQPQPQLIQEYTLKVPKTDVKPITIMRFNGALDVDPSKWSNVKMHREDNSKLHKVTSTFQEEEQPKFGAGSEYGREAREEARRRKYGMHKKKYDAQAQPWVLKVGDKINRKFKGVREGGVAENASYYIFTQAADKTFEVFPVQEWYNFTPIQRYKSLTAEEAEQEFGRRNKIMNYFSLMVNKRMKAEDDGEDEAEQTKGKKGKKVNSEFRVSEMDDWDTMDQEELSDSSDENEDEEDKKPSKKKAKGKPKKKKKGSDDEEPVEESDDGDEEGRELDYISDSSESDTEEQREKERAQVGVDQEVESGSESEEEETTETKDDANKDEDEAENGNTEGPSEKKKKKKKKKKKESGMDALSDDEDGKDENKNGGDEVDAVDIKFESELSGKDSDNSRDAGMDESSNVPGTSGVKRKATSDLIGDFGTKRSKMEVSPALLQSAAADGITEEAVRRYLIRKPMTVTDLLTKFKSKKTKISSQDMVNVIANILKKINPSKVKRPQNQKMYLFLKN